MNLNKILICLGITFVILIIKNSDGKQQKIVNIGDLSFTLDEEIIGSAWVSEEGDYLSFDLSLPDLSPYDQKYHGKNKVRINVKKIQPNHVASEERLANVKKHFGAIFNYNNPYSDLNYYSTGIKHHLEYFTIESKDEFSMVDCDKIKEPFTPQCKIAYIYLSNNVIAKYFYPRIFLSNFKVTHSEIKLLLNNLINKEG
ncbi:hypothetical protein [Vibrio hepatarius]|uniref:hypothetical protein n=1 Tax=Vibrio hepatarius TaxID=171383 RepID=UPI001C0A4071|nr:hypothetical protein [Vibrio hepatarius]MBU2895901.1 hypothetical protein [Vibrio hepatarius]